jgi:hypothetical protein
VGISSCRPTVALSPAITADLNFFQNVEKSVCAKAFENNNSINIPANQVCPRTSRIDANEFRSDQGFGDQSKRLFIDLHFENVSSPGCMETHS